MNWCLVFTSPLGLRRFGKINFLTKIEDKNWRNAWESCISWWTELVSDTHPPEIDWVGHCHPLGADPTLPGSSQRGCQSETEMEVMQTWRDRYMSVEDVPWNVQVPWSQISLLDAFWAMCKMLRDDLDQAQGMWTKPSQARLFLQFPSSTPLLCWRAVLTSVKASLLRWAHGLAAGWGWRDRRWGCLGSGYGKV